MTICEIVLGTDKRLVMTFHRFPEIRIINLLSERAYREVRTMLHVR